jgi:hypothetical protein
MDLDDHATERVRQAIWTEVASAALRVGCPAAQARHFFALQVANCKPYSDRPTPRDADDLRREYRARLEGLLASISDPAGRDAMMSYLELAAAAPKPPAKPADGCPF